MIENLCNEKMDVYRETSETDSLGGESITLTLKYSSIPCRLNFSGGALQDWKNQRAYQYDGKIYTEEFDLVISDRIKIGGDWLKIVRIENVDMANEYQIVYFEKEIKE